MRWRTYERLKAEHDAHVQRSLDGIALKFRLKVPGVESGDG